MKKENLTQQDVWKSQKRFYDIITGVIIGILILPIILFGIIGFFWISQELYCQQNPEDIICNMPEVAMLPDDPEFVYCVIDNENEIMFHYNEAGIYIKETSMYDVKDCSAILTPMKVMK